MHMPQCPSWVSSYSKIVGRINNSLGLYNASKASLATASETWRHELQPLGVRTVTLITCAVKTNFFDNNQAIPLPPDSRYNNIKEFIYSLSDGHLQAGAISSEQYAVEVVRKVDKGASGVVWAGTDAFLARAGFSLSPPSVFVSYSLHYPYTILTSAVTGYAGAKHNPYFSWDG